MEGWEERVARRASEELPVLKEQQGNRFVGALLFGISFLLCAASGLVGLFVGRLSFGLVVAPLAFVGALYCMNGYLDAKTQIHECEERLSRLTSSE